MYNLCRAPDDVVDEQDVPFFQLTEGANKGVVFALNNLSFTLVDSKLAISYSTRILSDQEDFVLNDEPEYQKSVDIIIKDLCKVMGGSSND